MRKAFAGAQLCCHDDNHLAELRGRTWDLPNGILNSKPWDFFFFFFLKDFIYLIIKRGAGREKEREKNINVWLPLTRPLLGTWPATQACALTGNGTGNPLVLRLALKPLSHTSQGALGFLKATFSKESSESTNRTRP